MISHKIIYEKLRTVIPGLIDHIEQGKHYGKSELPGYMDLHFNYLRTEKNGHHIVSLAHQYELNGDLVPDPDMEIRLMPERGMAEALTFQNLYVYQEVYENGYANERRKRELNAFLDQWLTNILAQGHRIDLAGAKRELDGDVPDSETKRKDDLGGIRRKDGNEPQKGIER